MKRLLALKALPALCLALALPTAAWANITPSGTTITGLGPYVWSYDLQLAPDGSVFSGLPPVTNPVPHVSLLFGAFVTIYDFAGYVAGSCTSPAGWTCTVQNTGFTPDDVLPNDDATLPNLTWVYTSGATISGQPDGLSLGTFSAQSIYKTVTQVSYTSRVIKNTGSQAGTIADNVGRTQGPTGFAVPEPGSIALAGLGLGALVLTSRRPRAVRTSVA